MISLLFFLSCNGSSELPSPEPIPSQIKEKTPDPQTDFKNRDQGQKHPPLPANNPIWEWDAQSFVPDFGWFGEHSWMDVRMRVAGHLSAAARDLARHAAISGNYNLAAQRYNEAHQMLKDIPSPSKGFSAQINEHLKEALQRDEHWMRLLDSKKFNESISIPKESFSHMRDRYFKLALLYDQNPKDPDLEIKLKQFQNDLIPHLQLREDLKIDQFSDFIDRHHLRVRLYEAYLDSLDPIAPTERWGYWQPVEIIRQALLLGWSAQLMGGNDWSEYVSTHTKQKTDSPQSMPVSAILWPSKLGTIVRSPDQNISFSPEELGALPTGDSLIDIAAHPGPKAIGTLERLGLNDPKHYSWLDQLGNTLKDSLLKTPKETLNICKKAITTLDSYDHGSRFYNVKQLRNSCVRQLALSKHYDLAYELLEENFPLHHQDWACPNRAGILHAISGRLMLMEISEVQANNKAEQKLNQAISEGLAFLKQVTLAEQGKINGPRPPAMGREGRKDHTQQPFHKPQPALRKPPENRSHSQQ
ncbi:MAG: hypothetical protein CMK59_01055 [Proteobacteria bacterium]|nr:hypothetical protein [Pseudomonadota bacterium]